MTEAIKAYRGHDYLGDQRTATLHHVTDAIALGLADAREIDIDEGNIIPPCEAAERCNGCMLHSSVPFTLIGHIARFDLNRFNVELHGTCTGFTDGDLPLEDRAALLTLEADPDTDNPTTVDHAPNYKPPCGLNMVRVFNGTGVELLT